MSNNQLRTEADRAAHVFYGQPADTFSKQIAQICRNDERLIAIFEQTRATYLQSENVPFRLQS